MAVSLACVVPLTVALSAIISAIAAEHAVERRSAWHIWLASLVLIGGFATFIAAFIWVGRQLPS